MWPRAGGVRVDGMFDGRVRFGNGFGDETTFSVPAEKCGLVIGKGTSEESLVVIWRTLCCLQQNEFLTDAVIVTLCCCYCISIKIKILTLGLEVKAKIFTHL